MLKPVLQAFEVAQRFREGLPAARAAKVKTLFAKASDERGELYLYDVIGGDWFGNGITAEKVADALKALGNIKTLDVYINSEGGDVWQAKAIYACLLRCEATKNVYVDGIAASAASFIAMAGDTITTAKAGTWMVHEAECLAYGRADDLQNMADMVRQENKSLAGIYADQTGGTVEEMLQLMADTTWMNAEEALRRGFTDSVRDPDEDGDEDEKEVDAASKSKLVALSLSTDQIVRQLRQERRLQQLSARASPSASRSGQPQRPTPQPPKDPPR